MLDSLCTFSSIVTWQQDELMRKSVLGKISMSCACSPCQFVFIFIHSFIQNTRVMAVCGIIKQVPCVLYLWLLYSRLTPYCSFQSDSIVTWCCRSSSYLHHCLRGTRKQGLGGDCIMVTCILFSSPNIIWVIESQRITCVGHVAHMGKGTTSEA